jgi:hypothetical protein
MRDGGNIRDLADPQRRLRWALDGLPDRVRAALPLVEQFATATWDEYFGATEVADAEPHIREELRAVRTRVAQGLPVSRRWLVTADLGQVSAGRPRRRRLPLGAPARGGDSQDRRLHQRHRDARSHSRPPTPACSAPIPTIFPASRSATSARSAAPAQPQAPSDSAGSPTPTSIHSPHDRIGRTNPGFPRRIE